MDSLKNQTDFIKNGVAIGYLEKDGDNYEWTESGEKWKDENIDSITNSMLLGVTGASKTTDTQRSTTALAQVLEGSNDPNLIAAAAESSLFKSIGTVLGTEDVNEIIQQLRTSLPKAQAQASPSTPVVGSIVNQAGIKFRVTGVGDDGKITDYEEIT